MQNYKLLAIAIIGFLLGTSTTYVVIQFSQNQQRSELISLQTQFKEISDELDNYTTQVIILNEELDTCQKEIEELNEDLSNLQEAEDKLLYTNAELETENVQIKNDYQRLAKNYSYLIEYLEIIELKNYTRKVDYSINLGEEKVWKFYLPYGAIWEATITLSYDKVIMSHSWISGENRKFVGSSSRPFSHIAVTGKDHLNGSITCNWYEEGSSIYVSCSILSEYSEIAREADDWILKR